MKIVFAGTPEFAKEHLRILLGENEVSLVLTQPDRRSGRGKILTPSPVKVLAQKNGIEVIQPKTLRNNPGLTDKLQKINPDLILVVAYGLMIPKEFLNIPRLGCINIHASILPRWRGASPIESTIIHGDKKSGLSFMRMDEGLDTGPTLQIYPCKISLNETAGSLTKKLLSISEKKLNKFIGNLRSGLIEETKQNESGITYAKKITRKDTEIVWEEQSALDADRLVRAFYPKMGAFSFIGKKRIKILKTALAKDSHSLMPGEILIDKSGEVLAGCANNTVLKITLVQLEGKKPALSADFVRRNKDTIKSGSKFNKSD